MKKKINLLSSCYLPIEKSFLKKIRSKVNIFYSINSREKTLKKINKADVYLASAAVKFDEEIINKAKKLKLILSPSTGTDHLDLALLKKKKIQVLHIAKEYKLLQSFTATSEIVFGLILNLTRNIFVASQSVKKGIWARERLAGKQLYKKTFGIIGLGRLGRISAKIAKGFGMNVLAYDINKKKIPGIKNVSFNDVLKKSDYVTIHVHLNEKTINLINRKNLKLMKKDSILINTSRGKIVNQDDLLFFLKKNKSFKAGLDVIDGEWLSKKDIYNHPLVNYSRKYNNLILLPHIGGSTIESIYGARIFMLNKLMNLLKKKNYGLN